MSSLGLRLSPAPARQPLRRVYRRVFEFLKQGLEHPRGFLAAGYAKVQSLLLAGVNCARIIFAVVAALAAILLRHGCHHAPTQRLAIGKAHALGEWQGLVVPRGAAIVLIDPCPMLHQRAAPRPAPQTMA